MSQRTTGPAAPRTSRRSRHLPFRGTALLLAALLLGGTGAWRSVLSPWIGPAVAGDHGWVRTPEAHVLADAASSALLAAAGLAAVLAAVRPVGRSGLVAWIAGTLVLVGAGSAASTLLQQHGGLLEALLLAALLVVVSAVPVVATHPERRSVLAGGAPDPERRPARGSRLALAALVTAGAALAAGACAWRLAGGVFEDPREDDVVSFALLGLSAALGAGLCRAGRAGWRPLGFLLGAVVLYAAAVALTAATASAT